MSLFPRQDTELLLCCSRPLEQPFPFAYCEFFFLNPTSTLEYQGTEHWTRSIKYHMPQSGHCSTQLAPDSSMRIASKPSVVHIPAKIAQTNDLRLADLCSGIGKGKNCWPYGYPSPGFPRSLVIWRHEGFQREKSGQTARFCSLSSLLTTRAWLVRFSVYRAVVGRWEGTSGESEPQGRATGGVLSPSPTIFKPESCLQTKSISVSGTGQLKQFTTPQTVETQGCSLAGQPRSAPRFRSSRETSDRLFVGAKSKESNGADAQQLRKGWRLERCYTA